MKEFAKLTLAAAVGGAMSLGSYQFLAEKPALIIQKEQNYGVQARNEWTKTASMDFSVTAEKVTPAVVHIKSTIRKSQTSRQQIPESFRDFFGDGMFERQDNMPREGTGSGVIISANGYIVTNNHVIEDADEIEVSLPDNRTYKAKIIGIDPTTDLALLQINEKDLPTITLGNSDQVKVGQWVLAVGNPFNLSSTVTAGIVSAKGRNINILKENAAIESFIQTDAAVNPGNSGGALVDSDGNLIGINTAIASTTGSFAGYSFAVPVNMMNKVIEDLLKYGKVQRAFLGIRIRSLDGNFAKEKALSINEGVYVESLQENSSAKEAGVKEGDVIVKIDDKMVKSAPELQEAIGRKRPGDKVTVIVHRKGEEKKLEVSLKNMAGNTEISTVEKNEITNALGATLENLSKEDQKKYKLDAGVKISKIYAGKLRSQTDIREGFVITKVNKTKVSSVEELTKILEKEKGGVLLEGTYDGEKSHFYGLGL
ncbi:MAG: Do family serine endopeptidase [Bacteroidetes bacterium]|nr:MAG: Do family serine endopeptidase [Bacteroidota bacterium]